MAANPDRLKYLVGAAVVVMVGVTIVWAWFAWRYYDFHYRPPETPGRDVVFVITPGETFLQLAGRLEAQGLIKNRKYFVGMAQDRQLTTQVKAGEFLLSTGMLPDEVLVRITTSAGILHRFTVREGLTWWQTARLAEDAGLCSVADFAAAVHDKALLERLHIPADSAEGYLFPETYMLSKALEHGAEDLVELMVKEFFAQAREVLGDPLPRPEALHRLVILASIVEKETGFGPERPTIAGVYANRLKRPMRLQADPTVIYGLGPDFDGNLRTKHLEDGSNPYNTYQHDGLPPGPICSPGALALKAAAEPEAS
ncbi:MAG: endolytic transglycosylase MltG, partial [Desulfovibrionaceae bacterium]